MIEKRERIIEAAFHIFADKGYHSTKMEEIAEEAGIGKGTLYSYFQNKQDLFDTMVFWFMDKYFLKLEAGIKEDEKIEETIKKFIFNHIEIIEKTKASFINVLTDFSNIPRSKKEIMDFHHKFINEKIERYSDIFEKAKERGELRNISPQLSARFLLGALKGISEFVIVMDEVAEPEIIAEEVVDLLCYGIAKKKYN